MDSGGIYHNFDFIVRNITVKTFYYGENIFYSGLQTLIGTSQWVFVRYAKTILWQGQVRCYKEMYEIKIGQDYEAG